MKPEDLKLLVKEKYSEIALQSKEQNESSCCGATGCCSTVDYSIFSDSYSHLEGYVADADLGLGCGLPTEFALIKEGDTVIDLGSGAGNDCFVARSLTGESGEVIGIDMTEAMIAKARDNARKLGFTNVSFRLGDIEKMPVTANKADVIISNCVLNLVPDKQKAFSEIYRVLKHGGHLSVSDVVVKGQLPVKIRQAAELYAGCVSGAIEMDEYLSIMASACLTNIKVQKTKQVNVPDEILSEYLSPQDLEAFKNSGTGIFSITVYAEKPLTDCGCSSC
jgi:ubiquinone/menaquinone biosynthesis C-methylase UbiE